MDEDTAGRWGLRTVWYKIAADKGTILTRYVNEVSRINRHLIKVKGYRL
jgi:hypothetical protein